MIGGKEIELTCMFARNLEGTNCCHDNFPTSNQVD